jgi:hypothetical protein
MIKTLWKLEIEGMYLYIMKVIYDNSMEENWNHLPKSQAWDKGAHSPHSYST